MQICRPHFLGAWAGRAVTAENLPGRADRPETGSYWFRMKYGFIAKRISAVGYVLTMTVYVFINIYMFHVRFNMCLTRPLIKRSSGPLRMMFS